MQVIYTGETAPTSFSKSIFLAGPSPRSETDPDWRPEALTILEEMGYDGVVFCPTWREGIRDQIGYDGQVDWEIRSMEMSDRIVFWVPRKFPEVPALTTNVEYGLWIRSGKAVVGFPIKSDKNDYLENWARREHVSLSHNLSDTLREALKGLSRPAERSEAERFIPPELWALDAFTGWYDSHKAQGNRLEDARVQYRLRVGPSKSHAFLWVLWAKIWVQAESRYKENESVMFRPDTASILCLYEDPSDWLSSKLVLVREFRSPVRNQIGMVVEIPGGSVDKDSPQAAAAKELKEETGIKVAADRMVDLGTQQVAATLCAYQTGLMGIRLTLGEMTQIRMRVGEQGGNEADSERTYLDVMTIREVLESPVLDWAQKGMILTGSHRLRQVA